MEQDRKHVIIQEILYWKENKLLPETYCNFLLALYTEGASAGGGEGVPAPAFHRRKRVFYFLMLGALIPLSLLVFYFNGLPTYLQISFVFIFYLIGIFGIYYLRKTSLLHALTGIFFLLLLLGSLHITTLFLPEINVYSVLLVNVLIWTAAGIFKKLRYYLIVGTAGLLLTLLSYLVKVI
ncbi:hypothetical protein GJU40_03785 [Bacillus lacus]|uniref:Uncharacterized protein n=1 Tax=Metabacillus lacus TaxID=1983721 RepID=A0A7X2IXJ2_9BACI|nr:hypothetical protein [Metabacillus lacus]MRX71292.1 hypothetical protein [Metabacillus lacus]